MIVTGIIVALAVPNSYFITSGSRIQDLMHDVPIENIPTLCIWSMHIAQSSLTATPSFPSSFDTKTLTLSVKARGLIALVHLCPYRRSLPACMASPQARCST